MFSADGLVSGCILSSVFFNFLTISFCSTAYSYSLHLFYCKWIWNQFRPPHLILMISLKRKHNQKMDSSTLLPIDNGEDSGVAKDFCPIMNLPSTNKKS
ncbi:hypothetical protein ZOSMA_6G02200 [Zostera marina]|uniref:Uncharacterized protein n=1 Tax=Zostera marina TaxID=29655 RepID=A0A0K9NRQ7_ZOSMR|nr:hypothetical protein ZOSMA_6G02200 [Zostera marina]